MPVGLRYRRRKGSLPHAGITRFGSQGFFLSPDVRPGHQLVKIVYDELVVMLGERQAPIVHATVPPTVILLVGLQGSGKTTTAAKLARRLKT